MRKILIIDTNYGLMSDIESRLILEEIEDVEIITRSNLDNIADEIQRIQPTELLVAAHVLKSVPDWNFGIPIKSYAKNAEGIQEAANRKIPSYGVINKAGDLLPAIISDTAISVTGNAASQAPPVQQRAPQQNQPAKKNSFHANEQNGNASVSYTTSAPAPAPVQTNIYQQNPNPSQEANPMALMERFLMENQAAILAMMQANNPAQTQTQGGFQPNLQQVSPQQVNPQQPNPQPAQFIPQPAAYTAAPTPQPAVQQPTYNPQPVNPAPPVQTPVAQPVSQPYSAGTPSQKGDIRAKLEEAKLKEAEEEKRRQMAKRAEEEKAVKQTVEKDMGNVQPPARLVTVFSAKGGVGKTTISCELATFLALTSHGRGKFKVCIADYNIDFGDVMNTLSFDPTKACMTLWAADIREKIKDGADPDSINYTEAQISTWLQHNEENNLYALIGPITNEDSMDITDVELRVMLSNLVHNGGFDFVICDTGNNTRDSSYIPLKNADEVLLVLTQSVNSANCNNGFLSMVKKIGFDMDKIKIVVNKVRPGKEVGITVGELEETFVNPYTNQPYQCVGRIKDSNQVRTAGNLGEPLVYKSGNDFTKSVGEIASYLIGDHFVLSEPEKKKGFFSRFRKK